MIRNGARGGDIADVWVRIQRAHRLPAGARKSNATAVASASIRPVSENRGLRHTLRGVSARSTVVSLVVPIGLAGAESTFVQRVGFRLRADSTRVVASGATTRSSPLSAHTIVVTPHTRSVLFRHLQLRVIVQPWWLGWTQIEISPDCRVTHHKSLRNRRVQTAAWQVADYLVDEMLSLDLDEVVARSSDTSQRITHDPAV